MAKFDNAKVGDRVWSIENGWGKIERIVEVGIRVRFVLSDTVEASKVFTFDGKRYQSNDKYPMLFWNEVKLPTDEEDKKPFDLVEFLRENLSPADFTKDVSNDYLGYDYCAEEWKRFVAIYKDILTVYFISICDTVLETLTNEKITPKQLKEAYKELGWL